MGAWPGEELEERASDVAVAAETLLRNQLTWRHRRVETLTVINHEQVRRHVSVDFTVPADYRENLRISEAGEYVVPLALLDKRPLVHFDLRHEEGHSVPLLTAQQNAMIDRELLDLVLDADLAHQDADDETRAVVYRSAGPLIQSVLDSTAAPDAVQRLEREHGLAPLSDFGEMAEILSREFVLWAVLRDIGRRRVLKFAYDEPFEHRRRLHQFYDAPGCTQAGSYHLEVLVPADLRARSTILGDRAGRVLATGTRDSDRPALYFAADVEDLPVEPGVSVSYGAERGRFLVPAAIVATVICVLVALPWLFADLEALAGSAGPAIGLVLSTSAIFSALVLRTDEHPLLRIILVRYRICLVACTLSALFAAAALGFRAESWLLNAAWGVASVVSAVAAGILIHAAWRSPSASSQTARENNDDIPVLPP
jgi:hypothetical protein